MSKKTEQSQSHSTLPEMEDFDKLSLEDQEAALKKDYSRQEKEEQDKENSEKPDGVSEDEELEDEEKDDKEDKDSQDSEDEEASEDEEEDSESDSTDKDNQEGDSTDKSKKGQQLKEQIDALTKRLNEEIDGRKALQADYTKKATELKRIKEKEASSEDAQATSDFEKELKELEVKDPEIGKMLRRMHEGTLARAREEAQKKFNELQDSLKQQANERNLAHFHDQVAEAMQGKYKDLEKQFDDVTAELYPDDEGLQLAASENPNLFSDIEKEVRSRYPREVVAAEDKAKKSITSDSNREKDIKKVKGIKKTKITKKVKDVSSLEAFKDLSLEDQEKELQRTGKWSKY